MQLHLLMGSNKVKKILKNHFLSLFQILETKPHFQRIKQQTFMILLTRVHCSSDVRTYSLRVCYCVHKKVLHAFLTALSLET